MVDSVGVEPTSHRLRAEYNASIRQVYLFGGTSRTRTDHLLLAKQALSQMSYGPMAGDDGLEPPNVGIKIRCLTNLANPQQNLAYPEGFEPPPTVLETVMLPLTPGIYCNALLPMRVLKDTIVTALPEPLCSGSQG